MAPAFFDTGGTSPRVRERSGDIPVPEKESKPTQSKQVDIGKELKKFKDLLDQELITQDDYDAKKKELLGL